MNSTALRRLIYTELLLALREPGAMFMSVMLPLAVFLALGFSVGSTEIPVDRDTGIVEMFHVRDVLLAGNIAWVAAVFGIVVFPQTLVEFRQHGIFRRYMDKRLAVNRDSWDERTPAHAASDFYDVEGFKKGRITLTDIERQEIGDVYGKTLLHLQCHFGLDTMSWSRLGAKATGVDFSDAAIGLARELNEELGLGVRFINSNI